MNPVQLYVKNEDGEFKALDGWGCGNCRRIVLPLMQQNTYISSELGTKEAAEQCCAPKICACGSESEDKYHSRCRKCAHEEWTKEEAERERKRFEKAKKITEAEYNADKEIPSFVYEPSGSLGSAGDNGWNTDLDELRENYEEAVYEWNHEADDTATHPKPTFPTYVWASKPLKLSYDVSYITEHVSQDAYDDYEDSLTGVEELQKYIDDWCAQQPVSYEIDYSTAIILDQPNEANSN